ncbi:protein phosphatase 2c, putative [Perkinsus marinus ATCC 50983]|uniref:protein-serine/threonine phosphatase n=1 Tax=Perkinsus marinus (strain ATCC 50983 / TXsc) TaxID=423536 RepID=C5L3Q0_PERM5|nr:protein phosphatase 2c, putative [Perkinsus marinus ATCC 50983]EER08629.1 protein phosphatase 2c, putative [Perkinsus marinus ATCC 50983]|eukprot:XP_002776813.1 protein phosphatase 2c, putative [Perkinsus marinus ATCC 50983]
MGAYRSKPETKKELEDGFDLRIAYGSAAMQGWRSTMEDAHVQQLGFNGKDDEGLFAIFDGHGGKEVALFCARHFPKCLSSLKEYKEGDVKESMRKAYLKIDEMMESPQYREELLELMRFGDGPSSNDSSDEETEMRKRTERLPMHELTQAGCTATACHIVYNKAITIANAGDSRVVLCRGGKDGTRVVPLTEDHKPDLEEEAERIRNAGGIVMQGRVNGNLNLTRAIGDLSYKQDHNLKPEEQMITANPDVSTIPITEEDQFLVLGCDGIWEILDTEGVVNYVRPLVRRARLLRKEGHVDDEDAKLSIVTSQLLDAVLSPNVSNSYGLGCDNMSCIIVDLRPTDPDSLPDTPLPEPGPAMETVYEEPGSSLDDLPDEETRESYHPSDCMSKEELSEAKAVADVISKTSS